MEAGVESLLSDRTELNEVLVPVDHSRPLNRDEMQTLLRSVTAAGLRRMGRDRYLNRLLFHGLGEFPDLLERYREGEIAANQEAVARLLQSLAGEEQAGLDWSAIAAVLVGATAHYWLLTDLFGTHPSGVDHDRFIAAIASLASDLFARKRREEDR
ncbi:MAG: hypothetical protein ACREQM_16975 [Candidatus Dormibacteraceae bacterium]